MKRAIAKLSDRLRGWLVGAIAEGTKTVEQKPPISGHVRLLRLRAARSLIEDGASLDQVAAATGVEPEELRRWLAHLRSPVSARIRRR
jgi:hypothetical protein